MFEYLMLIGAMLATGLAGGLLAGLLGVGGGIVIVPVLEIALGILGVDPAIRMHVAVATSLATIIPTSIASSRAHYRHGAVDIALVKRWALVMLAGALLGTLVAGQVHSRVLYCVFAVIALLVAVHMISPWRGADRPAPFLGEPRALVLPATIGTFSSMMGIGGGTMSVPVLTLLGMPVHRAVGTAALFGLVISIPGTAGFILAGVGNPATPPGSVGYVNLIGLALIVPATVLAAPVGAKIAHSLSQRQLSVAFGLFLCIVSVRMFYKATSF